jgi:hypothetical protein
MKTDVKGCTTIEKGTEQYESYYSPIVKKNLIQYQYRAENGKLFSCVRPTLEKCQQLKDIWIANNYNL